ncbi:unnamed protein product [Prunus armeniaca]
MDNIGPIMLWYRTTKQKGVGSLKNMPIFPLSHPILCWSLGTGGSWRMPWSRKNCERAMLTNSPPL